MEWHSLRIRLGRALVCAQGYECSRTSHCARAVVCVRIGAGYKIALLVDGTRF